MIFPSKFTTLDQSILSKAASLNAIFTQNRTIGEAFQSEENPVRAIDEFILAIDLLWILDKVEIDPETGELIHIGEFTNVT